VGVISERIQLVEDIGDSIVRVMAMTLFTNQKFSAVSG
jgi:hypothetical protein